MFEYKITLPFKVQNCAECPFRREEMRFENVESKDKISGVVSITRRESICMLKDRPITYIQYLNDYNCDCPLKNNIKEIGE